MEVSTLEKRKVKVFFVDFGNFEWISWDQFTDIAEEFWDLAPQALPFKLSGELLTVSGFALQSITTICPQKLSRVNITIEVRVSLKEVGGIP